MPVMSFSPDRSCALMLGKIMCIVHWAGWPLQLWPRMEVARLMWTGPRRRLLMVRLEAWRLRCLIGMPVAIAVALVCVRSAREAMLLYF